MSRALLEADNLRKHFPIGRGNIAVANRTREYPPEFKIATEHVASCWRVHAP